MNAEQKAYFEYGIVKASLKGAIEKTRNDAPHIFGEAYCRLTYSEKKYLWIKNEIEFFVKKVRQKRRACQTERNCLTCGRCFYFQIGFHGESMSWCHNRNCPARIDDDVNGCSEYEPLEK